MDKLEQYDYIRFTWSDLHGIARGKVIARRNARAFMEDGIAAYMGSIVLGPRSQIAMPKEVVDANCGNITFQPVVETLYDVAWASNEDVHIGEVFCEPVWNDGSYFPVGPRYVARKQLDILKQMGYKLLSACEVEGQINYKDSQKPLFNGKDLFVQEIIGKNGKLFYTLDRQLAAAGINVGAFNAEWGNGQIEWSLAPYWGIDTADKTFSFKTAVKEVCDSQGFQCFFTALPFADSSSNGCHFNHSLWDEAGNNVFQDKNNDNNLSELGRYWLGGLMKHGRALAALGSPTVTCYRRMHRPWASDKISWGYDDRMASIRVKTNITGPNSKGPYIENRYGSTACNPYLLLAVTVAAGIGGIKNRIEPPPVGDPKMNENAPFTLAEALDALEADKEMCSALGEQFIRWFLQCKRDIDLVELADSDITKLDEDAIAKEREFYKYV